MKIKTLFFYLLALLFLVNCGKDDDAGPFGNCNNASFSCTIDGADYIIGKVTATFNPSMDNGIVKVLDINVTNANDGSSFSIRISNFIATIGPGAECIGVKQYSSDPGSNDCISHNPPVAICDGTIMNYSNSDNIVWTSFSNDDGFITINDCDSSGKTVSGNFDFTVENLAENTSFQLIGQFSNLCFDVQ